MLLNAIKKLALPSSKAKTEKKDEVRPVTKQAGGVSALRPLLAGVKELNA